MTAIKIRADQVVAGDVLCEPDDASTYRRALQDAKTWQERDAVKSVASKDAQGLAWPTGKVASVMPSYPAFHETIINRGPGVSPVILENDMPVYVERPPRHVYGHDADEGF